MTGFLIRILLFLLPILLFVLWVAYARNKARTEADYDEKLESKLKRGMLAVGLMILGAGVYVFMTSENNIDTQYVPPRSIDGNVEPGRFDGSGTEGDKDDEGT